MSFTFTPDQRSAMDAIIDWYRAAAFGGGQQTLTLGGYAGTGKTTLLGQLSSELVRARVGVNIHFASYTGKAVSVLRGKLPSGSNVSTLHRLLYTPRHVLICTESGEEVPYKGAYCETHQPQTEPGKIRLSLKELSGPGITVLESEDPDGCEAKQALSWLLNESPLTGIDLVVVDEASMVSEKIWSDLIRWGVPVLAVGDHGQLPPVKSAFNLMANPQIRLERIMRQVAESPIIKLSIMARKYGRIPQGDYGEGCMKIPRHKLPRIPLDPANGDLVICGMNRTRNDLNAQLRYGSGHKSTVPEVGDYVICLRNSYENGIFNGMRGVISHIDPPPHPDSSHQFAVIAMLDEDFEFSGEIAREQFGQPKTMNAVPRSLCLFDYGYAITCHKAQGSQAPRVIVIEEMLRETDHARWLYTAVTRAEKEVIICGR